MSEFATADYMTTGEASRYLGVSAETVRRWVDSGQLAAVRTASGRRLVLRASVATMTPRPAVQPDN